MQVADPKTLQPVCMVVFQSIFTLFGRIRKLLTLLKCCKIVSKICNLNTYNIYIIICNYVSVKFKILIKSPKGDILTKNGD